MKRRLMAMLLVLVMAEALVLPASATGGPGFYKTVTQNGLTAKPADGTNDRLTVTYKAATAGYEYLVMLVSGEGLPTASNEIRYINQTTATGATVEFTVYPIVNDTGAEEQLTLFLTSNDPNFTTVSMPITYYSEMPPQPPYKLGDIDDNGEINTIDAGNALLFFVRPEEAPLTEKQQLAADVDMNKEVNTVDAGMILLHFVGICEDDCPLTD